jgi:hypothetical protein
MMTRAVGDSATVVRKDAKLAASKPKEMPCEEDTAG